jgi:VCBS repeat-containing protein
MPRLARLFRPLAAAVLVLVPAALHAQAAGRALVYCPVGLDETGCTNIVAALGAPGGAFAGAVDRGYDGTGGTVDLATADLSGYRVFVVPSLSDGASGRPYDRLRDATVAARLKALLTGRRAVWSGTPDLGTGSAAEKTALLGNLATWAAGGSGAGLVALLDNSDDPTHRYDWLAGIGAPSVGADTTEATYGAVQPLTTTGTGLLTVSGGTLAYPNMASFGLHAGSGAAEDARGVNADSSAGPAVLVTAADGTSAASAAPPPAAPAAKAMVYCPVTIDASGCDNIVAALTASGTPFTVVDRAYDGTGGTLDLRSADLGGYAVMMVPSLADGAGAAPYAMLRDPAVAARLKPLLVGPVAVWSGTPDLGTVNAAQKSTLVMNLAQWAAAAHATSGVEGLVVLQDASDDVTQRYGWVGGISHVSVTGDSTFAVHDNVQVLTTTGTSILDNGFGLQLGYSNMASWGLVLPAGAGLGADATGGRTSQVVLATTASAGGAGAVLATITTDKQDYAPGETVTITGSGWAPGETVNFVLHEDPTLEPDIKFSAVADASGNISNQSFTPDAQDAGVRFVLTATGVTSGRVAQATFTDGTPQIDAVSPTPFSPTSSVGVKDNTTITVKNQGGGTVSGITARIRSGTLLSGTLVREISVGTLAGNASANVLWDGRDNSAAPVADGLYTVRAFSGGNEENGSNRTQTVVVDNTNPTTTISAPATGTTGTVLTISGSASDQPAIAGAGIASVVVTVVRASDNTVLSTGPASNTASWSYSYTPTEASTQIATAKVTDNAGNSFTSAGVQLVVKAPNHAPVANNDSYNALEDQALSVAAPGVLGNDTDADGDVLAAALVSGPANGSLTLNPNGSFTYTPNANFFGTDQFTYRASDGTVASALAATVTVTVAGVNDPPSFVKGPDQTVTEGAGAQSVSPWATAISAGPNEAGQTVSFVVANDNNALFLVQPSVASDGTLTFTPALVANGVATVTVTAKDNGGVAKGGTDTSAPQTFTITVKPKAATALAVQPASGTFGGTAALSATLTSGGNPVVGKSVAFKLNGTSAGSATTDASGVASIATASLAGINVGTYPAGLNSGVRADFAGDGSLASSTAGNTLTVAQAAATMKVTINGGTPGPVAYGSMITLTGNLTPNLSGETITFDINGTVVGSAVTSGGGVANLSVNLASFPALVASTTAYTVTGTVTTSPANPNYTFGTGTAPLTINKAAATLAFGTTTFPYDGSPKPVAVTTTPANLTGVSITYAGSPTAPTNAGSYALVATLTNPNYTAPTINGTLVITKADQTIAFAALADRTFGDAPFTVSATASSGLAVAFAVGATDNCTISGTSVTITGAGSCTVTASQAGDGNYNAAPSVARTFTIAKASPVIAWSNPAPITYGTALGATQLSATATGVGGAALAGTLAYTPASGTILGAGNGQSLSVLFTPSDVANYTTATKNVTIDVLKFTPVASVTGVTVTYDKHAHGATAFSVTGANNEDLTGASTLSYAGTGSTTYGPTATAPTNGGTYQVTVSYPGSANYNPISAHDAIVINRATPTVAVTGGTFPYDKDPHAATGSVTGIDNDPLGPLTFTYNGSPTAPVNAGTYAVIGSFAGDQNYEPATGNAQIVINPVAPKIVWATPAAIVYGTPLSGTQLDASATGIGGEAVSGTFAYSPAAGTVLHVTGSPHTLSVAFTSTNPNYTDLAVGAPTDTAVTLVVNPAPLTATAENKTKVYGSDNPSFTVKYAGFVNGDGESAVTGTPSLTTTATAASGVAGSPYAIAWGNPTGVTAADYTITPVNGQLTVTPAPLTVTADAKSKLYGGATPPFTATITGFVNGENLGTSGVTGTAGFTGAATGTTPLTGVGGYTITPTAGSLAAVNYAFTSFVDGTLTINPAPLAVKADDKSRVYGDDNPAFTATITGFVNGENVTTAGVSGNAAFGGAGANSNHGTNVGAYPITPSAGTLVAANYTFDQAKGATYADGTLTITKAPLSVVAASATKAYGDGVPTLSGTVTGIKNSDNISATYTAFVMLGQMAAVTATTPVSGSPYPIVPSLNDPDGRLPNYAVTAANGQLTVTKATPVIANLQPATVIFGTASTAISGSISYTGVNPGGVTVVPTGSVTVTLNGVTQSAPIQADGTFSSSFATGTIDVTGNPYPVTYAYAGDSPTPGNFNGANATRTLNIIDQTPPLASNVVANPNPVASGSSTQLAAQISDAGRGSSPIISAVAVITGGSLQGPLSQGLSLGAGTFTRSATATLNLPTGVYSVCVTGTDAANNVSAPECTLLAVYDASAGFVTGGGWINSPQGAYVPNPSLVGKANFGFVSKYQKGANVPTGDTEFQFQTAGLNFKSTSYDWLVISGTSKAQYKGSGTLNGVPGYGFILTAIDGKAAGTGVDRFRIKITGPNGLVYDNQLNAPDTSDPTTALGGGSIVVHK